METKHTIVKIIEDPNKLIEKMGVIVGEIQSGNTNDNLIYHLNHQFYMSILIYFIQHHLLKI